MFLVMADILGDGQAVGYWGRSRHTNQPPHSQISADRKEDGGFTGGGVPCLLGSVWVAAGAVIWVGVSPVSLVKADFLGDL